MKPRCIAAVGMQWGDEGKGKIIDWLASWAGHVARYQGGHNAGHTLVSDQGEFVLHLIPSGIFHSHSQCYIGQGVVLNLGALLDEVEKLKAHGVDPAGRLSVSPNCSLILRHHVQLDIAREQSTDSRGTTRRGIGPAHEDKAGRRAVRLIDVLEGDFEELLQRSIDIANCELVNLHGQEPVDIEEIGPELKRQVKLVKPFVGDVQRLLAAARDDGEQILLEASQGALLDIEQGSYPYVTSASCLAGASASGLGVDLKPEVIGIAKAYTTRVGEGEFPTQLSGEQGEALNKIGKEFGATTARRRRVGWLDIPALRHALLVNGCRRIALTKLDVLGQLDTVKICVAYSRDGTKLPSWPPSNKLLSECVPEYIEMPGWGDLAKVETYEDLPEACRQYIERIEQYTGASVDILSHGPERDATFFRNGGLLEAVQ